MHSLNGVIAYALLRLADIEVGDVVVDPLCGGPSCLSHPLLKARTPNKPWPRVRTCLHIGASIAAEGWTRFPSGVYLNGELDADGVARAQINLAHVQTDGRAARVDLARWDARHLPLRSDSIDVRHENSKVCGRAAA